MLLKTFLNTSSILYLLLLGLSIAEVSIAFSVYNDVKDKHAADSTITYFRIAEIILPPLPALELLALVAYVFLIFLHAYKRKTLMFAMDPENKNLRQQPVKEKEDGLIFYIVFKSFLVTLFHGLAIFFSRKAVGEFEKIYSNTGNEDVDEYARLINTVFALNIVSIITYYLSVASDSFLHKQERKFYKNIAYESV